MKSIVSFYWLILKWPLVPSDRLSEKLGSKDKIRAYCVINATLALLSQTFQILYLMNNLKN